MLRQRIIEKINKRIESGKIPLRDAEEWLEAKIKSNRKGNVLEMTEFGELSDIALELGVTINPDPDDDSMFSWLKIEDLPSRVDQKDNEAIAMEARVIEASIVKIPKKDKETGVLIPDNEYEIARIEIADPTGICNFSQFAVHDDNGYMVLQELWDDIESKDIIGKTIVLKKIKVKRSMYTGHEITVEVDRGGEITFDDKTMDFEVPLYETTPLRSVEGSKSKFFFLLKISSDPGECKLTRSNKPYRIVSAVDEDGTYARIKMWFDGVENIEIKKDDIVLVEGRLDVEEYQGKKSNNINIWRLTDGKFIVNPEGYDINITSKYKQKSFANALIGDFIETTVMIKRFFTKKPYYLACPVVEDSEKGRMCIKGIKHDGRIWKCNGGHELTDEEVEEAQRIAIMSGEMVDDDVAMPFNIFDRGRKTLDDGTVIESIITSITGRDIDNLLDEYDSVGEKLFYERINQDVGCKWFRAKMQVVLGKLKGKPELRIIRMQEINVEDEIKATRENLISIT